MPTLLVLPGHTAFVFNATPPKGRVKFYVEAHAPIDVIITDENGMRRHQQNLLPSAYAYSYGMTTWQHELYLPPGQVWCLLLLNRHPTEYRAVHWEAD